MKLASQRFWVSLLFVLLIIVGRATFAETKDSDGPQRPEERAVFNELPPFHDMLATAMKHHPGVRAAKVELDEARRDLVKEIGAFRQQWQSEMAALASALAEVESAKRKVEE